MSEYEVVAIEKLRPSSTKTQEERRKHYEKAGLDELAASIGKVGILQPIVTRRVNGHLEIVAGERRHIAAKIAKLEFVPVSIRELSDQDVLEVQLIENLEREGLHELAEAEGYEMLMQQHGYSAEDIIAKFNKSRSYVYGRLKLLALTDKGRKAFYDKKISASVALLLARIPVPSLQNDALKRLTQRTEDQELPSYREAKQIIESHYMLSLGNAPFDTKAEDLVKDALPCAQCPKNTLAQPDLFSDIKQGSAGVCTDPQCFQAKTRRSIELRVNAAKDAGKPVIEGDAAKKIFPHGAYSAKGGFQKVDDSIWAGGKSIKVKSLLGKEVTPTLVRVKEGDAEKLVEVVDESEVKRAMKEKGIKDDGGDRYAKAQKAQAKERKLEGEFRRRLYDQVRAKLPRKVNSLALRMITRGFYGRVWSDVHKKLFDLWKWKLDDKIEAELKKKPYNRGSYMDEFVQARIDKMSDSDLLLMLFDCCFASELAGFNLHSELTEEDLLPQMAKALRIDPKKIRSMLLAEKAESKKPKAKAAKKAKGKKS